MLIEFAFLSFAYHARLANTLDSPCPFNKRDCDCTETSSFESTPFRFAFVDCKSNGTQAPAFVAPSNVSSKYSIDVSMRIQANIDQLPPNYFNAFNEIAELSLSLDYDAKSRPQNWSDRAFDQTKIDILSLNGLEALFPAPEALIHAGARGLRELHIYNFRRSIRLEDYAFKNFSRLEKLSIDGGRIIAIGDNALAGLENSLTDLKLLNVTLEVFPAKALKELKKLQSLLIGDNDNQLITSDKDKVIRRIDDKAFAKLPLEQLRLEGAIARAALDNGTLDNLPKSLERLYLDSSFLKNVPKRVLQNGSLTYFSLSRNAIDKIEEDDFVDGTNLATLYLDQNPISEIEKGAFRNMKSMQQLFLSQTKLTSIDLSIFGNVSNTSRYVELNHLAYLKNVTVSRFDMVSGTSVSISIKNSSLETIDPKIADLLKLQPKWRLDFANSDRLKCRELDWMAHGVLCTLQLIAYDCKCADKTNQTLVDYLKSVSPKPNCTVTAS